jgi:hypothetical protein
MTMTCILKAKTGLPEFQDSPHARQIVESDGFVFSKALLGNPMLADSLLSDIVTDIAFRPYSFPLVVWPDTRMALISPADMSIGIYFQVWPDDVNVELLLLAIKPNSIRAAA